jgi:glycosyltransferase involved in cell wall biosynthesis
MPNVILESLSCGTRVVATDVGGVAEVVSDPVAGCLLAERTVPGLVRALKRLRDSEHDRDATRQFAVDNLGWAPVVEKQLEIYKEALAH